MHVSRVLALFTLLLLAAGLTAAAQAEDPSDETRLLRFPDIHVARRLTAHEGLELFPKISPDGAWIAFTAEYTGSRQVFVMPADGGPSRQLTFYNDVGATPPRGGWDNWILDWTREGRILKKLAYCPVGREFRTWKRTRGGRAQDIWIYDFTEDRSTRLTDSPATENFPLWSEDTIYFTSDADYTLNLYAVDSTGGETRRVTEFAEFDVLWPSLGPEAIVFMNGGFLYRLDLDDERVARIPVRIETDLPLTVAHFKRVDEFIDGATLSPSGARAAFSARGELFTVPATDGPTRNLSRSPDSTHIAFGDRDFNLTFSSFEFNYVYRRSARVYAAAPDPQAPALFPPKSDEEEGSADPEASDEDEPLVVEPEGWVLRTIALPGLPSGDYSSGGDALPCFFKHAGLGPPVGTRTWGGLIGLSGNPSFVDGGTVSR